jgi:hypothetical protein
MDNSCLLFYAFYFVIATDPSTGTADLFVSKNHGESWHNANLPLNLDVPYLYPSQILAEKDGAIWIGGRSSFERLY